METAEPTIEWPQLGPFLPSRKIAKAAGELLYFTGKPCNHGHISPKWVCNYKCAVCTKLQCRTAHHRRQKTDADYRLRKTANASDWGEANPERRRETGDQWLEKNRDKANAAARRNTKKPERKAQRNQQLRERRQQDAQFRIMGALRTRIGNALKGVGAKSAKTEELLDCSVEFFMRHIQHQFTEGMSWDNYGDWEIDHIRPCASFDLTKPEQQRECFSWRNQQPLWKEANARKSDNWEDAA